jgi:hypothetical protein
MKMDRTLLGMAGVTLATLALLAMQLQAAARGLAGPLLGRLPWPQGRAR